MIRADLTGRFPRLWLTIAGLAIAAGIVTAGASGVITKEQLSEPGRWQGTSRATMWKLTWPLAAEQLPLGSGLGSFVPLYRMHEDPVKRPRTYANHAHNDYLEWVLETGLWGLAILAIFLFWFARQSRRAWQAPAESHARAASIAIVVVALHSLVDYPIRTAAIATLLALCCALLAAAKRPARSGSGLAGAGGG